MASSSMDRVETCSNNARKFCAHCQEWLHRSTYYRHREKYYDHHSDQWLIAGTNGSGTQVNECDIEAVTAANDDQQSLSNGAGHENDIEEEDMQSEIVGSSADVAEIGSTYSGDQVMSSSNSEIDSSESGAESDLDDNNPEEEENIVWPWEKEYEHQNKQTPNLSVRNIGKMLTAIFLLWQFIYNISNSAMSTLIKILRVVFLVLSQRSESEWIAALYEAFSTSYNGALKTVGITETHELYVVCPKCNLVYQSKNCVEYQFGQLKSVKCSYVEFPNHPHKQKRAPCGAILCDEKLSINNTIRLIPKKVYPCVSLETELKRLISQPNFLTKCEHWRTRPQFIPPGILADVYEGRMWKFFNSEEGGDYLKYPGNLLFALNFDFFQPFSHTRYSIGALYLTVLNLPRNERYKTENIILVCLIPGPHEPKLTINQYLAPFVQEMKSAYDGYLLSINDINIGLCNVLVRGCIACVTCDVPAVRKLCGFLGHTARLGCSKCLKEFPTQSFGDKPDYSGYDRHLWPPRSLADHKINCDELSKCKSKSALSEAESNYGIRYSLLLDLPMFDPIRFSVIDPMHNLLLGTSKYMFTLWQDTGILTYHHLLNIETLCEKFQFPHDVGRLPLKIGSSFSGFTADQWRIWTTVLSPVALKTALPDAHYKCWLLFMRACTMLCTRIISESTVDGADRFLLLFCQTLESLHGHSACTPNHHLSLHLRECLLDYGPVHSMWCFPFERYNGILNKYHTNKKYVENQIMKKFFLSPTNRVTICRSFN